MTVPSLVKALQLASKLEKKNAALQAENANLTQELADAQSRNMDLSSQNAQLMGVCEALRNRVEVY